MGNAAKSRAEKALDELVRSLELARSIIVQRLEEMDFEAMRRRGVKLAGTLGSDLQRRVRPRPRRRVEPAVGIAGLLLLSLAAVGVGYLLADRSRRAAARGRLTEMPSRARERYAELRRGRDVGAADLEKRVRQAIALGGTTPEGLDVAVEGRTVYLRGTVPDPASVDAAAERAHGVEGVVAVVNLTTGAPAESPVKGRTTPTRS